MLKREKQVLSSYESVPEPSNKCPCKLDIAYFYVDLATGEQLEL